MRILSVIPGNGTGSEMIFARYQADALAARGNIVSKFYVRTRTSILGVFKEWGRLRSEIRRFLPDVIHCHYGTVTSFLVVCSTSKPLVVTYRGSDLNPDPDASFVRAFISRLLSQISSLFSTQIICVSKELASRLWWDSSKAKVTVIPTGVDTDRFLPMPKSECRSRLGWNASSRIVLINVGRSPKVKRIDLAEEAASIARNIIPELELVKLYGDVDPALMPIYHNAADVLLLTSDYEGSPTIVQEAIACGLPVVSVDVGDIQERLCGVTPSEIVERNPQKLAEALVRVFYQNSRSNGPKIVVSSKPESVIIWNLFI